MTNNIDHVNRYPDLAKLALDMQVSSTWCVGGRSAALVHACDGFTLHALCTVLHSLPVKIRTTPGCAGLSFVEGNESLLNRVAVLCTNTPRWSRANEEAWGWLLAPGAATLRDKPQQPEDTTTSDLSKFGMSPQVIPLPAVQLLWLSANRAFRDRPETATLFFQTKIMVAVLEVGR